MPGATYIVLQDRYLENEGTPPGFGRPRVVGRPVAYDGQGPASIAEYLASPARWPRIVGVLSAGTRLRFERLVRRSYPLLEDWYEASAVVEEGPFRGTEVELLRVSAGTPDSRMLYVDPSELRLVHEGPAPSPGP